LWNGDSFAERNTRALISDRSPRLARESFYRGSADRQVQKISAGKFHFEPPFRFTSLDHLVREREQPVRSLEAERLCSLEIDD